MNIANTRKGPNDKKNGFALFNHNKFFVFLKSFAKLAYPVDIPQLNRCNADKNRAANSNKSSKNVNQTR